MAKTNKIGIFRKVLIIFILTIITIFIFLSIKKRKKEDIVIKENINASKTVDEESSVEKTEKIKVYVCGEVNNPGVYECEKDARYIDCINMAGSFTEAADKNAINLAMKVEDATKVYVPSILERSQNTKNEKVNINTASLETLANVSGIGKNKAILIIEYRNKKGLFKSIEEIKKVSGIKEATFNKIKDKITI